MTERWRCFVAVALAPELRDRLGAAVRGWAADPRTDGMRWVEPGSMHLTLAFLGPVDPDRVGGIADSLTELARAHPAHVVPTGRLGTFPRPGAARVLWYGVGDPAGRLASLARDVGGALRSDAEADAFHPHVTLARARRRPVDLRGWIDAASAAAPEGSLAVEAIRLERSHLGSGPARYETLATVTLRTDR